MSQSSWKPRKKVVTGLLVGLLTIVGQALATGAWDTTEWGSLVTLGIATLGAYAQTDDDSAAEGDDALGSI